MNLESTKTNMIDNIQLDYYLYEDFKTMQDVNNVLYQIVDRGNKISQFTLVLQHDHSSSDFNKEFDTFEEYILFCDNLPLNDFDYVSFKIDRGNVRSTSTLRYEGTLVVRTVLPMEEEIKQIVPIDLTEKKSINKGL